MIRKNTFKVIFIVLNIMLLTNGCNKDKTNKDPRGTLPNISEYESELQNSTEEETQNLIEETSRETSEVLPDVPSYNKFTLDGYKEYTNIAQRFIYSYPSDYEFTEVNQYISYFKKENTQISLLCLNEEYNDGYAVSYSAKVNDFLDQVTYLNNGEYYKKALIDRSKTEKIQLDNKVVFKEIPMIEFTTKNYSSFIKPNCIAYYISYDNRGFMLLGISDDQDTITLEERMKIITNSLSGYLPSKSQAQLQYGENNFIPKDNTGISFPYPEGWNIENDNKTGFVIISAPHDGSIYDGSRIIYKSDEKNDYVNDFAQFAGIPSIIAYLSLPQGYDSENIKTNFTVLSMDDKVRLNGAKCYLFEIEDQIIPLNKAMDLLLPASGPNIKSYRYTFNSNDIPVMISFQFDDSNRYQVRDMADDIISKLILK